MRPVAAHSARNSQHDARAQRGALTPPVGAGEVADADAAPASDLPERVAVAHAIRAAADPILDLTVRGVGRVLGRIGDVNGLRR